MVPGEPDDSKVAARGSNGAGGERVERDFEIKCPFCGHKMRVSNGWKCCIFTQQCEECEEIFTVNFGEVEDVSR